MTNFKLEFLDQQKEFTVTRQGSAFHVEWDGRSIECRVRFLEDSYFVLEIIRPDGTRQQIHAAGSANGDRRQLWVDGQMVNFQRVRQQRGETHDEGSLAATIPAVVTQVMVTAGDFVSAGEKLVLLESMKMIIPIQAPYDGVVAEVHCKEGDSVQAGVQLIELAIKEEK